MLPGAMPDKEFLHWLEGAQLAASWRTTDGKIVSFCVLLLVESEGEFVAGDLPAIRSALESGSCQNFHRLCNRLQPI